MLNRYVLKCCESGWDTSVFVRDAFSWPWRVDTNRTWLRWGPGLSQECQCQQLPVTASVGSRRNLLSCSGVGEMSQVYLMSISKSCDFVWLTDDLIVQIVLLRDLQARSKSKHWEIMSSVEKTACSPCSPCSPASLPPWTAQLLSLSVDFFWSLQYNTILARSDVSMVLMSTNARHKRTCTREGTVASGWKLAYLQQRGRCMNDAASPQTFFDTNSLRYLGQFQGLLPMKNLLKPICIKLPMYLDTVMNHLIEKTMQQYFLFFFLK